MAGSSSGSSAGKNDGWDAKAPKDTLLRPAPSYSIVAGGIRPARRATIFGYDKPNGRIIAIDKADGAYQAPVPAGRRARRTGPTCAGCTSSPAPRASRRPSSGCRATAINQAVLVAVPDGDPGPSAEPIVEPEREPAQGDPEADQEALTGRRP